MTIVLSIAGLGARWLGCYGNEWVATPNLDRLAAEGVVYDNCYAETVQQGESICHKFSESILIDTRRRHKSQSLRNKLTSVIFLPTEPGPRLQGVKGILQDHISRPDDPWTCVISDALTPPWYVPKELFEDYYEGDAAEPIVKPSSSDSWNAIQSSFAAALTLVDAEIGELVSLLPDATWVITSDYGLHLGEHGAIGDDITLYQEIAHLPLIVRNSDYSNAGRRIKALTSPADLELLIRGKPVKERNRIISHQGNYRSIRTEDWTLLDIDNQQLLFQRPSDQFEVNDVARLHPEVVEELQKLF